jgi:hypothetical protein
MNPKTVLIVPSTVPDAMITRLPAREPEQPHVISAEPAAVPTPTPIPLVPERLTAEQVAVLRQENEALREELARVHQRSS